MPLVSVDISSGAIVTDWYSLDGGNQRIKINVRVVDEELSDDSLEVKLFKQIYENGRWVDLGQDDDQANKIQSILEEARALQIASELKLMLKLIYVRKYNFKTSEKKWQTYWDDQNIFKSKVIKDKKYYILEMFPYPSENTHGTCEKLHFRRRYCKIQKSVQGYNVMHPGWDAFGPCRKCCY